MTRRHLGEWRRKWQAETSLDSEELDELQEHLLEAAAAHREAGVDEGEAIRQAMEQLGPPPEVGREYDKWRTPRSRVTGFASLTLDIRYAFRQLRAHPFFTSVAIASVAVAVASNTIAFSVINGLLLRDPGFGDSEALVEVYTGSIDDPSSQSVASWPISDDLSEFTDVFEGVVGYEPLFGRVVLDGDYMPIFGEVVSGDFFDVLRVPVAVGRTFTPDDERLRSGVAVLSYDFWQSRLGGRSDALGKTMEVNGEPVTVIGVVRDGFSGAIPAFTSDVWLPRWTLPLGDDASTGSELPEDNRERWLTQLKARLRPGVTAVEAEALLVRNASSLAAVYPESYSQVQFRVIPTDDIAISPAVDGMAFGLAGGVMGVVAIVLVVASMNLAGFLLARGADRWAELQLRQALGATRTRLIRQLFTESLLLAASGGLAGLGLCVGALNLLQRARLPIPIILQFDFSIDGNVLVFTLGAILAAATLFGLIPALSVTRVSGNRGAAGQASTRLAGSGRARAVLLTIQVAASLTFLVWGSLFTRSLWARASIDPGFRTTDAAVVTLEAGSAGYTRADLPQFMDRLRAAAARRPELDRLAFTSRVPMGAVSSSVSVTFPGETEEDARSVQSFSIEPGYFVTMRIALVEGRGIATFDRAEGALVVVASRSFMERYGGAGAALGATIEVDGNATQIVGVVEDVAVDRPSEGPTPHLYQSLTQTGFFVVSVVGTATGTSGQALRALELTIDEVDPTMVVWSSTTIEDHIAFKLLGPRVAAGLLVGAGVIALLLTVVGVVGSVSHAASRRSYEMAIRLSLGATPKSVTSLVLTTMLRVIAVGAVGGLIVSFVGSEFLTSMLFGVRPFDVASFGIATLLLTGAALVAAFVPARRAGRTELTTLFREG